MKITELDKYLATMNKERHYAGLDIYLESFNKLIAEIAEYNGSV